MPDIHQQDAVQGSGGVAERVRHGQPHSVQPADHTRDRAVDHPPPDLREDDGRDRDRKEKHHLEESSPDPDRQKQSGGGERKRHRSGDEDCREDEVIRHSFPEARFGEQRAEISESDEVRHAQAIPIRQRQEQGCRNREGDDREAQEKRRQNEQPGRIAFACKLRYRGGMAVRLVPVAGHRIMRAPARS